jgi:hypothetical protein
VLVGGDQQYNNAPITLEMFNLFNRVLPDDQVTNYMR